MSDLLLGDDLDRKIVAHLCDEGRATYGEIGTEVGLSAPAVKRRVDRLLARGVIQGFQAVINPDVLGTGTEAFVELHCRSRTNPADIAEMVASEPDVVAAYTVTGDADALLHIRTTNPTELEAIVERVRAHQNAERTKTTIVLSRVAQRPLIRP
jgi:DNA-binding Lrp family transcriptional regulator